MTQCCSIISYLRRFHAEEAGAATVEMVVGAAAAVTLALVVTSTVSEGVLALSDNIAQNIENVDVAWTATAVGGASTGTNATTAASTPPPTSSSTAAANSVSRGVSNGGGRGVSNGGQGNGGGRGGNDDVGNRGGEARGGERARAVGGDGRRGR